MRVEYLSDNVGESIQANRAGVHRAMVEEQARAQRQREAEAERLAARRRRPWWRKVLGLSSAGERAAAVEVATAGARAAEATAARQQAEIELARWTAGGAGEQALADGLGAQLGDEWILFRGYRNRKGETDGVLLGPQGLWVVEVKNKPVELTVDGASWTIQKVDRWGNAVGPLDRAVERGQRTWGTQVGEVAGQLAWWLQQKNNLAVTVHTTVLVLHERARITRSVNPGVDLVATDTRALLRAISLQPQPLDPRTCDQVAGLIRRDHAFHNSDRTANRRAQPRARG